jgi:hypothetical protein
LRERFDATTGLVVVGAIVLLVSLFIDWYRPGGDAWLVFEWLDVALVGVAVVGLLAAAQRPEGVVRALPVVSVSAFAVVAVQLIDQPPAARGADLQTGAWLALAGTGLMAVGALLAAASISVTVDVRGRERRRRTSAIDAREGGAAESAAAEEQEATPRLGRRFGRREGSLLTPDEPPPPTEPASDPQRTQALDPIDRPSES